LIFLAQFCFILQLRAANDELRRELDAFDPQFFEDIEHLKREYADALAQIDKYESELRAIAREHHVSVSVGF
jgi:hypothetical protein